MWSITSVLVVGTAVRLLILLDATGPAVFVPYTQCDAMKSILYKPRYTIETLREEIFISSYSIDGILTETKMNLRHGDTNPNPFLLTFLQKAMSSLKQQDVVFSILALLVDLTIAYQLYTMGKLFCSKETEHMQWEKKMEQSMNSLIYPIRRSQNFLFGKKIADDGQSLFSSSSIPVICAMIYYLNPFTILTSASGVGSLQGLWMLLFVSTILLSIKGNAPLASMCFAILCQIDVNHIIFFIPLALLWQSNFEFKSDHLKHKRPSRACMFFGTSTLLWFSLINLATILAQGSSAWTALRRHYDVSNNFDNLTPNLGMHWYLFINIFLRYRLYFSIVCAGFLFLFPLPLRLRFEHYPMEMITMLQLLRTILNPEPTVQDMILGLAMVTLAPRSLARMNLASVFSLVALPVPIVIYAVDYWLFLETGSGNANYMFFQGLAYNLFASVICIDFISSTMKRDKSLRVTEKNEKQEAM